MDSEDLVTRKQAAAILQVSVSTVRRLEARRFDVEVVDGVHYLRAADVHALAAAERPEPRPPRRKLAGGELAREVFRRFDEGQGLSEIVQALALEPQTVRSLYREWRTPLELGELTHGARNPSFALPARDPASRVRALSVDDPQVLLDRLPEGQPTRLSVAAFSTVFSTEVEPDARVYAEQGGIVVYGPIAVSLLVERWGAGQRRVTAYDLAAGRRLWEVYCILSDTRTQRNRE